MSFLEGARLWLLLVPAIAVAAYVWSLLHKERYALRFSNVELLDSVMPDRPGWRRHLPVIGSLLAIILLVLAIARPVMSLPGPEEEATVVLVMDVSISMEALDVPPSRLDAAKEAALNFITLAPEDLKVGVVAFAGIALAAHPPSTDDETLAVAIERLTVAEQTAVGEGIYAALDLLEPEEALEEGAERPPAHIIVLSDGESTSGRSEVEAAREAAVQGIPISTVSFGTPAGAITYAGEVIPVPVNEGALRQVAEITDGHFFEAASSDELEEVLDSVGSQIGVTTEEREVWEWFLAAGLVLLMLAGAGSLVWFSRIP